MPASFSSPTNLGLIFLTEDFSIILLATLLAGFENGLIVPDFDNFSATLATGLEDFGIAPPPDNHSLAVRIAWSKPCCKDH